MCASQRSSSPSESECLSVSLKSTYVINANEVARRRVSLAGQRLADLLRKSF
jgi:hypothetical protein